MALLDKLLLTVEFPKLNTQSFDFTSPKDNGYNCIAWAAGENDRVWWPDRGNAGYWPRGIPREETLPAFIAAYETLGFERCSSDLLEPGYEKIVIFADENCKPKHAARQLPCGAWTSKLGTSEDIRHDDPRGVEGPRYGNVVQFMRGSS